MRYGVLYKNVGEVCPGYREVLSVFIHTDSVWEFANTDPNLQSSESYNPRFSEAAAGRIVEVL